ncbi:hypothetical protein J7E25_00900 [Agromyces sp. ISL-38]|uniref:hypothetical protein n=1 Tax=Agromyces sp. ISL-38 TaxID=2819107 RepID=UPI001BECFAC1|nr:hypothetical protein [Agromyces sp. ISL-38]MBT2497648.1 hypothetical protein [Agromyces sp. ISL-38]
MTSQRWSASFAVAVVVVSVLAGCSFRTEYHGMDRVDGRLWRQLVAFKEPLFHQLLPYGPTVEIAGNPPAEVRPASIREYLANIDANWWDGTSEVDPAWVESGGVVVYDVRERPSAVSMSIFIGSGPRPEGAPTDDRRLYSGPSELFTCFGFVAGFDRSDGFVDLMSERVAYSSSECPPELAAAVSADAAFGSIEVFDG